MNPERVKRLLKEKENIRLEFKEATADLPGNLFETICAMLNREGGDILLGVDDKGNIPGVNSSAVSKLVTDLVNLSNNPQKLDPSFILFPQVYDINGREVIHIQVPASSQVHKTGKIIYDRSNDGDFKVDQPHRIAEIANRKRNHYTEGIIYPVLRIEDFKQELFPKVRNLIRSNNPAHPWLALDDMQIMEISGLWKKDYLGGQEGFTLAAVLPLGKDEVIQQIIPHYKIDALVRINNAERYDDGKAIAIDDTVNDTISDTINSTISDVIKERLNRAIKLLLEKPGMKVNELIEKLGVSERTEKRDLEKIRALAAYRGSKKTGGYFLTDYLLSKLDKSS